MILNQQRRVRVSIAALDKFLVATQKRLRLPPDSLTVALVSDPQMSRWNAQYRGKNRPTDVLSFPADGPVALNSVQSIRGRRSRPAWRRQSPEPSRSGAARSKKGSASPSSYLGDIAIAPAVARRNALRFSRTFDQEMRILILHGVLHLMGYDHETDQGQMTRRENRLRRDLGLA
ncbi:MAG: rRNA maturation RNase YbeY [Candidatus Acidiferrales bacterium]